MTVVEFADRVAKRQEYLETVEKFYNVSSKDFAVADKETTLIERIETCIRDSLGYSSQEMVLNAQKRTEVYARTSVIHLLLGWYHVFKALQISIKDCGKEIEEYPPHSFHHNELLDLLEPYIVKRILKQVYTPNKPKRRPIREHSGPDDFSIPYMENSEEVKHIHCEIFHHDVKTFDYRAWLEEKEKEH